MMRERLPNRRGHRTFVLRFNGVDFVVGVGHYRDGRVGEIFIDCNKVGSQLQATASDGAALISLLLQHGRDVDAMRHSLAPAGWLAAVLVRVAGDER
jgi:ribonucleoside-diphosphate reductase alpha chain